MLRLRGCYNHDSTPIQFDTILGQYKLEDVAFPDDVVAFFDVKELCMKNKLVDEQNYTALVDGCAVVESYSNDSRI